MEIPNSITDLEKSVGAKEGFFNDLKNEDDWSFVIKLHAFFESICSQLLLFHFNQPELKDILNRLELSNKATGKIAFLEKLELISKENRRFISSLSELRNNLVHNVFNCEFAFDDYLKSLNHQTIKNMAISYSPYETIMREILKRDVFPIENKVQIKKQSNINNIIKRFTTYPKEHIRIGAHSVLVNIIDSHYYSDYKQWIIANNLLGTGAVEELNVEIMRDMAKRVKKFKINNSEKEQ